MKKLKLLMIGIGFLSFLSCTQTSQYVVEKYVDGENAKLPMVVSEVMTYDSIKCNKDENKVILYFAVSNDLVVKALKQMDIESSKKMMIDMLHKESETKALLNVVKQAEYSIVISYLTKESDKILEITLTPEEYGQEVDASQMENNIRDKINADLKTLKSICPQEVDQVTILKDVEMDWDNMKFTYIYQLHDIVIEDKEMAKESLREQLTPTVMGPAMVMFRQSNITIVYQYELEDDTLRVMFTPEDYGNN